MKDLFCINGRWLTMSTASRCVHHNALADACEGCEGIAGLVTMAMAPAVVKPELPAVIEIPPVAVVVEPTPFVESAPFEPAHAVSEEAPPTPPQRPFFKKGKK